MVEPAGEQLIIDAAETLPPRSTRPAAELGSSAGTTELINHVLASADPRAAEILRPPARPQAEQPEAEP